MKEVVLSCLQNGEEYEFCGSRIKSGKSYLEEYPYLEQLFGNLGACVVIIDKNTPENKYRTNFDVYIFPDVDRVVFCGDGKEMWPCCSMDRYVLISSHRLDEPYVEYVNEPLYDEEGAYNTRAEFDSVFTITGYYKGLTIETVPKKSYYNGFRYGVDSYHLGFNHYEESAFEKLTALYSKMR